MWTNDVFPVETCAAIQRERQREMLKEAETQRLLRAARRDVRRQPLATRKVLSAFVTRLKAWKHSNPPLPSQDAVGNQAQQLVRPSAHR